MGLADIIRPIDWKEAVNRFATRVGKSSTESTLKH